MSGIGWVSEGLVSVVVPVVVGALDVVTDSSLVGNVVVPLALTGGDDEELTTALSVVGNNGGALADGAGEADVSAVGVSEFSGSAGGLARVFSGAGGGAFTCGCNVGPSA